MPYKTGN